MISRYTYHGLHWVDLESPHREELLHISEEFKLPKQVEESLFSKTDITTVELYDNFSHLTLHFPQEVNFIIGKHFIITIHYQTITALREYAAIFENREMVDQQKNISDGTSIFKEIMKELYNTASKELLEIAQYIPKIEAGIFSGQENRMTKIISQTQRKLLGFKENIALHGQIFSAANITIPQYDSLVIALEGHVHMVKSLQSTNTSLLVAQSNSLLRKLVYTALVSVVLVVIAIFLWH